MATLSTTALTLADWAKRTDPDGKVPVIAELLAQSNEILEDIRLVEGKLPTGHRVTIRTGLPAVYWRQLNQGVPSSKSSTAQVTEGMGMLEAYARVDVDLFIRGGEAVLRAIERADYDVWTRRPEVTKLAKAKLLLGAAARAVL